MIEKVKAPERVNFFERIIAGLLLIIFAPILILISIISFIDTKKFPLFIQERGLTLSKYRFKIIKIRTIRNDSELDCDSNNNSILKKPCYYNNVSSIGKFLRKTGLDELPQLINILLGQMKFIGPRALSISDLQKIKSEFPEYYERRNRINSIPGILGLWQVSKDFECSVERLVQLDEEYEKNKSIKLDLRIFLKAIKVILFGYHIDSIVNGKKLNVYPILVYVTLISGILSLIVLIKDFWN